MVNTKTEKDLVGQVERLNRNTNLDRNPDLEYHIVHSYGKVQLMKNNGSEDISLGNTKTELYWQLVVTNKVLENIRREKEANYFD